MTEKLDREGIFRYWSEQAARHELSPAASWSDRRVIELEIGELARRLADGQRVLDVGCANGYSTVELATRREVQIRGLDYVPRMIELARSRLDGLPPPLRARISFDVGDITALQEPSAEYDAVTVIRVVINLPSAEAQARALQECARVLRPGGTLLLSEATVQGWSRLNALRAEWGLAPIPVPAFNRYLDLDSIAQAAKPALELVEVNDFASTYYVATRLLKPLMARVAPIEVDVADPDMEWNRWCASLPTCGDYGVQKLLIFRRT